MHDIETKIINLLQSKITPTLEKIGGLLILEQNWGSLSNSKLLDEILLSAVTGSNDNKVDNKLLTWLFNEGFKDNLDPIAIRDTVRLLCQNSKRLTGCFNTLLTLSGDETRHGILRRYYLLGAFEIALHDSAKKHTLIGFLLDIEDTDNKDFLSHAIKIIGLAYTLFDQEDLFMKLELLKDIDVEESSFEMGMSWLHRGLKANSQKEALTLFGNALKYFVESTEFGREDAKSYSIVLQMLHEFTRDGNSDVLKKQLQQLTDSIRTLNAWDRPDIALSWTHLRNSEILNWKTLSFKLSELLKQVESPAWFEPVLVIEEYLLKLYCNSRSIFNNKNTTGLDSIIQPVIYTKLSENAQQIYLLDQWLQTKTEHVLWPEANQLKHEILQFKSGWIRGNDHGTTETLEAVVPSFKAVPKKELISFNDFSKKYRENQLASTSKVVKATFENLTSQLHDIESFRDSEVQFNFEILLFQTLCFLEQRMNATKQNHPEVAYLFEHTKMPLEAALQMDYFQYMNVLPKNGITSIEISDIGGGRADVLFGFISHQFCVEVKRELANASFENLRQQYLGQALEYSNTSAKLGILLVLDLSKKPNGIGSLESNVKVEISVSDSDPIKRGIVVIRVPGNRTTPSQVKISNNNFTIN